MTKWKFEEMTWPEVRQAATDGRVVLIPVGAIEQHGLHLPVDCDNRLVTAVCEHAAAMRPDLLLTLPTVHFGFNEHNMDFPGTISIDPLHFMGYCTDIGKSLAHQGFRRIIFVNGHGSNAHLLESATRIITVRTKAKAALLSYWDLVKETFRAIRQSPFPGGANHACEFETSIYLHLAPELVYRDRMVRDLRGSTRFFWEDLMGGGPVRFNDWRSRYTESGVGGDPTLATPEKGERLLRGASEALVQVAEEFRALSHLGPRRDFRPSIEEEPGNRAGGDAG